MSMKKQYNSKQSEIKLMKIRKSMFDTLMISVGEKTKNPSQHMNSGRIEDESPDRQREVVDATTNIAPKDMQGKQNEKR